MAEEVREEGRWVDGEETRGVSEVEVGSEESRKKVKEKKYGLVRIRKVVCALKVGRDLLFVRDSNSCPLCLILPFQLFYLAALYLTVY